MSIQTKVIFKTQFPNGDIRRLPIVYPVSIPSLKFQMAAMANRPEDQVCFL